MGINGSIIELKIDENKIGRQEIEGEKLDGTEYITSFKEFFTVNQTLKKLSMSKCNIGDMAFSKFCHGLAINNTLRELNLKENNIGDDGATDLAGAFMEKKVRLSHLYLNKNFIKDRGAKQLAHAIRNLNPDQRTLEVLDLTDNSIEPDGAYFLGE
jgi:Ran GTPase-activating protein (RanGAP) involved in mRNA processing and transport